MELAQNPTVFNSPESTPRHAAVKFHGEGKTYFGIWLTNLLLTILTFGIYGAWAKVRTQQFMLGSIEMDGHRLRYHAKPMQILVGRLIAITFFGAFMATVHIFQNPILLFIMGAIYFVALPWAVNASLRFSLRMTSYRNVRFNFKGSYWGAMKTFILFPILGLIPFYLGLPWVNKKVDEYLMNNAYYGEKQFKIDIQTKTYYKAVGASLLVVFGTAISAGLLAYIISLAIEGAEPFLMIIFAGLLTASYLFGFSAYKVIVRNHIFNNLQIPGVATFKSDLQYRDFTHMFMKNLLYTVLTLGLYLPWAIVHYLQLLADATSVELQPEIATVNDTAKNEESAIADEAADLFDLDIALG